MERQWVVYDVGDALLLPKLSSLAGLAGGDLVLVLPSRFLEVAGLLRVWGRWPGEGVIARVTALGGAALGVRKGLLIAEALPVDS